MANNSPLSFPTRNISSRLPFPISTNAIKSFGKIFCSHWESLNKSYFVNFYTFSVCFKPFYGLIDLLPFYIVFKF